MNESKILELFTTLKALKIDSKVYLRSQNELFRTILTSPEVKKALKTNTWIRSFNGDAGECESIVNAGILKAIRFFDLKKYNGKFSTFLWTVINQEFSRGRKHKFGKKQVVLESIEGLGLGTTDSLMDVSCAAVLEEPNQIDEMLSNQLLVEHILNSSTDTEQQVLSRFLKGMTYAEIRKETKFNNYQIESIIKTIKERFSERYS